tara:strand:- start:209 stop:331 length:123 start_codon:yes stop_codon:yes gene_type:complete
LKKYQQADKKHNLLAGKKVGTGISAYIGCSGEEYDHGENW